MDAVFCFNDYVSRGVIRAVRERGLRVSADIGIIGYDNEIFGETMNPPITSVSYHNLEIGEKAAELMCTMLRKEKLPEFKYYLYEPEVIVRESSLGPERKEVIKIV
jgi:DNA-binding LacI/PurR family transcriptional regulator